MMGTMYRTRSAATGFVAYTYAMFFPAWSIVPFVIMIASLAVLPIVADKWWDRNLNKLILSAVVSIPVLFLTIPNATGLLTHSLLDYCSFLVMIASLYVIAGGIYIRGEFAGTPLANTVFLIFGALLSNVIGTTGASVLLIRPYLRANQHRERRAHLVIFFIFIVSNIGGLLTPLGDPPLFLGFLRGVPFHWTLRLIPAWAMTVGAVLIIFNLYDQFVFDKEDVETKGSLIEDVQPRRRVHIEGSGNFLYLAGVMLAAMTSGYFGWGRGIAESAMIAFSLLSWFTTPRKIHAANHFHFHPIIEVAAVFIGIFVTMVPTLQILQAKAVSFGLNRSWQYFWATGFLSGFLDNAPTYMTFAAMASGAVGGSVENLSTLVYSGIGDRLLRAISCGAVFMGANTYIGNGPNFMVKSIAQRAGVRMPSFGGYMVYSGLILVPVFVLVTIVFFR